MKCLRHTLNRETLKTLYFALIHSHLNYCLGIWSSGLASTLKPLFMLQKKIVRIICNKNYNAHTPPLFKKLGILPVNELSEYVKLSFMHDFINGKSPVSFQNTWKRNFEVNPRELRNQNEFHIPLSRCKAIERFPLYYYQKLWNERCNNELLRSDISKKLFQKNLKSLLMIFICQQNNCQEC